MSLLTSQQDKIRVVVVVRGEERQITNHPVLSDRESCEHASMSGALLTN